MSIVQLRHAPRGNSAHTQEEELPQPVAAHGIVLSDIAGAENVADADGRQQCDRQPQQALGWRNVLRQTRYARASQLFACSPIKLKLLHRAVTTVSRGKVLNVVCMSMPPVGL